MKWFKNLFNKWSGLKKDYTDYYQIRCIKLVDGTNKYYAEYKSSVIDNWNQLYRVNSTACSITLSPQELVATSTFSHESIEIAQSIIDLYKQRLLEERAKEFYAEDIIKVD